MQDRSDVLQSDVNYVQLFYLLKHDLASMEPFSTHL